jgi:hypothetical protein
VAVIIGFQVALSAAFDVQEALHIENALTGSEEAPLLGTALSPAVQKQIWMTKRVAYQTAVTNLLPWRVISSALLTLAAGLVFFFGMRLRVSVEDRARAAELLGAAAIGTAVLRSIDGAQSLVIARTVATETGRVLIREGIQDAQLAASAVSAASTATSVIWSLVMVAVFMGLSSYFRSEGLRAALARDER